MKDVIRSYCIFVLLDKPIKNSFRTLVRFCRRGKTIWLTPRVPLWARLLGASPRPLPTDKTLLLWELNRLSETFEGKLLTLVPLSQNARCFVEKNHARLEISYRLERKTHET